jgi:ribonuclease P/MRP protein subunit RPP40
VGSKGKGYEDRLQMLGLKTLETRRIRGDLIEVFNILRGIDNVDERLFFSKAISNTRGHDLKLYKHSCRLDCRKYCFSHRVVEIWNILPDSAVTCITVNSFKNRIDKFMESQGFL